MARRSRTRPPKARRTWPQRLLISFNCLAIVASLGLAGVLAYAKRTVGEIDRVRLDQDTFQGSAGLDSDDPRNFLIVGADSDDGLDASDPATGGRDRVAGIRSDTIMVVRVDPSTNAASIISFPRDLWVDIPGHSRGRINSALQYGGPESGPDLLIATIKVNFDIDINHYVQVDFKAFKGVVDALGGIPIYFATPVRDLQSNLFVQTPGCHTLDADGALAYVRSRYLRYQDEDGDWVGDPTSDLGRNSRQQDFIKRVLQRAISEGARNPAKLTSLVSTGVANLTLDDATTPNDLIALGQAFRNFDPEALGTNSLPVEQAWRGGADVLDLIEDEAEPVLAQFRGTGGSVGQDDLVTSSITVQVLNGSGTQDQASDASAVLATVGFQMSEPTSVSSVERTEVRYRPGREAEAVLVARHLFANPILIEDPDVSEIQVITGPDFGKALIDPRPEADIATTTTTTTVPESPTTLVGGEPGTVDTTASTVPGSTTTTTEPTGFVPEGPPPGVSCG